MMLRYRELLAMVSTEKRELGCHPSSLKQLIGTPLSLAPHV